MGAFSASGGRYGPLGMFRPDPVDRIILDHIYKICPVGANIATFLLDNEQSADLEDLETHLLIGRRSLTNKGVSVELHNAINYLEEKRIIYRGGMKAVTLTTTGAAAVEYFRTREPKPAGNIRLSKIIETGYPR